MEGNSPVHRHYLMSIYKHRICRLACTFTYTRLHVKLYLQRHTFVKIPIKNVFCADPGNLRFPGNVIKDLNHEGRFKPEFNLPMTRTSQIPLKQVFKNVKIPNTSRIPLK